MRRAGLLAVLAVVLSYASVAQGNGVNQLAHLALVHSLSHGGAEVDSYHWRTKDLSWYHGHYYSTKAPGLALLTVGPYVVLDRTGLLGLASRATGATREAVSLWMLGLIGTVLPAGVLLFLLRWVGDGLEPSFGTAAAVTAGLCTLLFPFATLFLDHALSTALGFAAFAVLWQARDRLWHVAGAGLLAGLAVTSEYPLALVAGALGLYLLLESHRVKRLLAYAGGVAVGVLPLLLYDRFAFGSPFHLSYADAIARRGVSGHDVLGQNSTGLFGVSTPNRGVGMSLLFGYIGLITITPVVLAGAAGLVLLWRKGRRREAALAGALVIAFVVYNSGYTVPFGGGSPGPRFLIPMLPFLALGFASAYWKWPWSTAALAIPSGVVMLGVTATTPLMPNWSWRHHVIDGTFAGSGVGPRLPLILLVLAAVFLTARATPISRPNRYELAGAALTFAAYLAIAVLGPRLIGHDPKVLVAAFALLVGVLAVWHIWTERTRAGRKAVGVG